MQIGKKIRDLRVSRKLTQQALAEALFVSRSTVAKWENGLGAPSEVNLEALCRFFEVEASYFEEPVTQEELVQVNQAVSRWEKIALGATVILSLLMILMVIGPAFGLHVFEWGLRQQSGASRWDRVENYSVAVYEHGVIGSEGRVTALGNVSDVTDYDWKHREMFGIVPYRRFLFFLKEAEPEMYWLRDETGTVNCGMMYVLRCSDGTIHYYYRRFFIYYYDFVGPELRNSEEMDREDLLFRVGEEMIRLDHYCRFTSETDFTCGEPRLYLGDTLCCFEAFSS